MHGGKPLHDADGLELRKSSIVVDEMFGDGIVTGTVPLEHGEGVNITIDWLKHGPRGLQGCSGAPDRLDATLVGSSIYMRL